MIDFGSINSFQLKRGETKETAKVVADGFMFPCRKVVMCWRGDISSIVIHDNLISLERLHSYNRPNEVSFFNHKVITLE